MPLGNLTRAHHEATYRVFEEKSFACVASSQSRMIVSLAFVVCFSLLFTHKALFIENFVAWFKFFPTPTQNFGVGGGSALHFTVAHCTLYLANRSTVQPLSSFTLLFPCLVLFEVFS